jgi:hypothetical protein
MLIFLLVSLYRQSDVFRGLDAKQPKLVATTVTCLREIVQSVQTFSMLPST